MVLRPVKKAENEREKAYPTLAEHQRRRSRWVGRLVKAGAFGSLVLAAGTLVGQALAEDPLPEQHYQTRGRMVQPRELGEIRQPTPPASPTPSPTPTASPTPAAKPQETPPPLLGVPPMPGEPPPPPPPPPPTVKPTPDPEKESVLPLNEDPAAQVILEGDIAMPLPPEK